MPGEADFSTAEPQENTKRKTVAITTAVVLVLLLATASVVWWRWKVVQQPQEEAAAFKKATGYFNTLEGSDVARVVPEMEKIIASPASIDDEAHAKILLGVAYASTGKQVEAAKLYKEVALSGNYPDIWRGIAASDLLNVADTQGEDFSRQYVFDAEPFKAYIAEGDFNLAERRLAEFSDALHSAVLPNYRIANWYAERLVEDKISPYLTKEEREGYLKTLTERLHKGDSITINEEGLESTDASNLLSIYVTRGLAAQKFYLVSSAAREKAMAEKSFTKAIALYNKIYLFHRLKLLVPFYYAGFLAEFYGAPRKSDIEKALDVVMDAATDRSGTFFTFLKNERGDAHLQHYHRREILLVAKFDERFKALLKDLGWTDAQLNAPVKPLAV